MTNNQKKRSPSLSNQMCIREFTISFLLNFMSEFHAVLKYEENEPFL